MKKITFLFTLIVLLCVANANAQYYYVPHLTPTGSNPGGLNTDVEYPIGGGLPGGWATIMTGPNATPIWSATQTLPFTFNFNGSPETAYKISSSGVLTFDVGTVVTAPTLSNASLPSALIPDKSVCLWGINVTVSSGLTHTAGLVSKTFGTAPNRQHWITYSGCGIPAASLSWVFFSIVLEETTNKIYFVDQRSSTVGVTLTMGVQINSSTASQVATSPSVSAYAGTDASPADNVYYEFIYGTQPAHDVTAVGITNRDYIALPLAPFDITGRIENWGSNPISSLVLNYSIDGGAAVSSIPLTVSLPVFGSATFIHPTVWTPTAAGTYSVKVWASSLNGNADDNTINDEYTKSIVVVASSVQRTPLFEVFTSSTCGPCASASPNLAAVFDANPNKYTAVKYQMNWPGAGDIYYNSDGDTRKTYYGVSGIPDMFVDGEAQNEGSYTSGMLDVARGLPSFMEIDAHYTLVNKKVTVGGSITGLSDFPANKNLKMHIAVVEFKTTGNVGSNGETEFHYVEHKMMPNGGGTTIATLSSATPYTINRNYTFPTVNNVEEFTDLGVMVFVQNYVTREVYQSMMATESTGLDDEKSNGEGIVKLFPNPVRTTSVLLFQSKGTSQASVTVYNNLGQKVFEQSKSNLAYGLQQFDLRLSDLPAGVYFAMLNLDGKIFSKKVIKV